MILKKPKQNKNTFYVKEYVSCIKYIKNLKNDELFSHNENHDSSVIKENLINFYRKIQKVSNFESTNITDSVKIDWLPTNISFLYWSIFRIYIKYFDVISLGLKENLVFDRKYDCYNYMNLLKLYFTNNFFLFLVRKSIYFLKILLNIFIFIRNIIVVNKKSEIIFFRYGLNDFRTLEIHNELIAENKDPIQAVHLNYKDVFRNFFNPNIFILFFYNPNYTWNKKIIKSDFIFDFSQDQINKRIHFFKFSYRYYKKILKFMNAKYLLSIDDTNEIYPFLFACQDLRIKTIAFQHGAYTSTHEAYIQDFVESTRWFDYLIVWGRYWKDFLQKKSNVIKRTNIIIGGNKIKYHINTLLKKQSNSKNILIPYEFLTDTRKVGLFIKKLVDSNFTIYFKVRVDELVDEQIDSYIPENDSHLKNKVIVVRDITPEIMSEIDIIAGTMTTLIFDLMIYKKPIWIFDLGYPSFLKDLLDEKSATLIKLEDDFNECYISSLNSSPSYEYSYYFNSDTSIVKSFLNLITHDKK